MYFALAHDKFEEAIKPELKEKFEADKKSWLAWDKWSNREPGLFKLEKEGTRAIALCSKCYYIDSEDVGKAPKISAKGMNKKQNGLVWKEWDEENKVAQQQAKLEQEFRWARYEKALEGYKDTATNRGFRMHNGSMFTYEQHKLGLSAYYDKRWVLEDGIHTEPIEFHMPN